jgi:hypothetical protein
MKTYILINRENHLFIYFITNLFCELLNFSEQCCIQDKLEMLNATNNLFRWKHQRYYAYREFVILGHVSFLCYVFFLLCLSCVLCTLPWIPHSWLSLRFSMAFIYVSITSYCYTINYFSCDACGLIIDIILFYM